ncbi:uncharacterized protein LOC109859820 isoform X3 [Pseudomyrmex gracilis]|uniref:uncharacterized protein LOC109859820 isoform X2 n=1 Tax=Pseudomyrmex gracilis TaxID=219809 RepID=UPI000995661F|nr:uncharacterized protein LOC109859820 isoform X2 [Pseudomyrmex gracilis]XP_020294003.1 uncharacterized protein LOC109859820 isoform X3 [Pseudomyrmex gracilis]XP_020294004.1 uncharacterized protein LOC109859820 isoform X3 [Pseudomyrmex gracilis]
MREFLDILPKIWAKKRTLNTASDEKEKPDDSKNISAKLHVSKKYLELLNSVRNMKIQCEKDIKMKKQIPENIKAITATEVKICSMFTDICKMKNLKDTYCDTILMSAMKILVDIYILYKCGKFNKAEELCKMRIDFMRGQELSPKYIILAIATQLQLNYILYMKNAPTKERYSCLSTAMLLYCTYTAKEIYPTPIKYDGLYDGHETNPKIILDHFHITILEEIIKIYIFYPHEKHEFVSYMHKLLKDTMEEALLQSAHLEWSSTCANLVFYFISHNRFCEAKSHLVIASKILLKYSEKTMNITEADNTSDLERDPATCKFYDAVHSVNLIWAQYATELIRISQERLKGDEKISTNNSSCEVDNSSITAPLVFDKTSEPVVLHIKDVEIDYQSCTDQYLIQYDDVWKLYDVIMTMLDTAIKYFKLRNNLFRLGETGLYVSRLHKYIPYFDGSSERINWVFSRIQNLNNVIEELSESTDPHVRRIYQVLYLELSLTRCTLLDMWEEAIIRTGENLDERVITILKPITKDIINCFSNVNLYDRELNP